MVLFCASGIMGIFGATHEGMTGEPQHPAGQIRPRSLHRHDLCDDLGIAVALIAIPQVAIQTALYLGAHQLMPLTTPVHAGRLACGGIIMLATGLRICGIKIFPIVNMLPALLLVMPVSALWVKFFA